MFEIATVFGVVGIWIYMRTQAVGVPADLGCYIDAVRAFQAGEPVYMPADAMTLESPGRPFLYPPAALYYFAPFGWFSATVVSWIDIALRIVVFGAVCRASASYARRPDAWPILFAAGIGFAPVFFDFQFSNVNTYLLGGLVAAASVSVRDRSPVHWAVAFVAGVVCSIKFTWLAALGVAIVAVRRWRMLGFVCAGAALTAVLTLIDWDLALQWRETLTAQHALRQDIAEKVNESVWVLLPFFGVWAWCVGKGAWERDERVWLLAMTLPLVLPGTSHSTPLVLVPVLCWLLLEHARSRPALFVAFLSLLVAPWILYWTTWAGWDIYLLLLHAAVCLSFRHATARA